MDVPVAFEPPSLDYQDERALIEKFRQAVGKVADVMNEADKAGIEVSFNINRGKKNRFEVSSIQAKRDLTK